ncbi:MAG: hypothetical protein ACJ75G_12235 [Gaiellaceae bacterium]
MSIPTIIFSIEVEGRPRLEVKAADADLDSLLSWLSSERVREQLDALVLLVSGRDTRD